MLWRSGAWRPYGWTAKEAKPIQYCLANLPKKTKRTDLVAAAKQCSIIECDYQELEQELGWGHYERRGWRGFHHHATLSIAAYGFLVAERAPFFPRRASRHYSYPFPSRRGMSARAGRPMQAERHNPVSITTPRTQLAHHILQQLERCPFCGSEVL